VLQFSKAYLLLGTFLLLHPFHAWSETPSNARPQVAVSVFDDVGISNTLLVQSEQAATEIFDRAGLDVVWQNCPTTHVGPGALVRSGELSSPNSESGSESELKSNRAGLRPIRRAGAPAGVESSECTRIDWPEHLALRIVDQPVRSTSAEVFGTAFLSAEGIGTYTDIFYDRAVKLHSEWNVELGGILGTVMAHELGHLLLGLNSHSRAGIMKARWGSEELRHMSWGTLGFTNQQGNSMQLKLITSGRERSTQMAVSTRSNF
jgi:hypothetical protein